MFRRHNKTALEETRLDTGEGAVRVIPDSDPLTAVVTGRISVESSPDLRRLLLGLVFQSAAPVIMIDLSAVTYLDMSGLAILLEALKAARERSVKLRITGISGEARNLVEIAQLDTIFSAWGSGVEFQ